MEEKIVFSGEYDAVLLTFSVLKRLGSGEVGSFDQRLRSQKVQYLAQLFGISPVYAFGLYLRGPYSSDLAHDLFKIRDAKLTASQEKFVPEELEERFLTLQSFVGGKSLRDLELITTLHLLLTTSKLGEAGAIEKLRELKEATPEEINIALEAIKQIP